MTLTLERMRKDIADVLYVDPSEIGDDDNLPDLGLDSMRLMTLILGWEQAGLTADFGMLAEYESLGGWWTVISQHQAAG